jgi:hypothetical protein
LNALSSAVALWLALWIGSLPINVPDPSHCTIPSCLSFCPAGDVVVTVVVHDFANNPIAGSTVRFDFSHCPTFAVCPSRPEDPYVVDVATRQILAVTNGQGVVQFPVRMGGVCPGATVQITADGVILGSVALASPDQDGDLTVTPFDVTLLTAKMGGSDPTGDLDCNGFVLPADSALVEAHLDHACDHTTRVRHTSWGTLKLRYR